MTCNFRVGQKVVKFRGAETAPDGYHAIKIGTVLTVRAIQTCKRSNSVVLTGLLFNEIKNRPVETTVGYFEADYNHENYRPVVQRNTDISIFKVMLNPSKEQVSA